jgi:hypothetical protein
MKWPAKATEADFAGKIHARELQNRMSLRAADFFDRVRAA